MNANNVVFPLQFLIVYLSSSYNILSLFKLMHSLNIFSVIVVYSNVYFHLHLGRHLQVSACFSARYVRMCRVSNMTVRPGQGK